MFHNTECKVDSICLFVDSMNQRCHSGALALLLPLNRQSVNVNSDTVDPYPLARDTELSDEWFPTLWRKILSSSPWATWFLRVKKVPYSFENVRTTHPKTQHHIPQDINSHLHHCEKSENFDICYKEKAETNAAKLNYLKVFVHSLTSTECNVSLMYYPGISLKKLSKTMQIIRRVASGIRIRHSQIQVQKFAVALTCSVKYLHKTK